MIAPRQKNSLAREGAEHNFFIAAHMADLVEQAECEARRASDSAGGATKKHAKPLKAGYVRRERIEYFEHFIRKYVGADYVERCLLDPVSLARRKCTTRPRFEPPRFVLLVDTKEPTHVEMVQLLRSIGIWAVANALECGDFAVCEYCPPQSADMAELARKARVRASRTLTRREQSARKRSAQDRDMDTPPPPSDSDSSSSSDDDDGDDDDAKDESKLPLSALSFYHPRALIERKAVPGDLVSSITDGRRRQQRQALVDSGVPVVVWLYVGYVDSAAPSRMIPAMNSAIDHDTFTLAASAVRARQVRSEADVPQVLANGLRYIAEDVLAAERSDGAPASDLGVAAASLQGRRKAALADPDGIYERALCQVPGVSDARATAIRKQCYPTMVDFISAVHACSREPAQRARVIKRLAAVSCALSATSSRKLGPKVAERLVDAFLEPYLLELKNDDAAADSDEPTARTVPPPHKKRAKRVAPEQLDGCGDDDDGNAK
jgi:hypothetical protein